MAGRMEREEDMSDYRRWISYIYAYENGIKKRNAGYAKLELKDGRLTMTLHVTPDGREGTYRVCMYKSQSGRGEGVLLGNVDKKQGGNGARFVEDAADLNGSGLLFQEMNGLLLYDERGKYLISSWEDEPAPIPVVQEVIASLEQGQVGARAAGNAAGKEAEDESAQAAAGQNGDIESSGQNAVEAAGKSDTAVMGSGERPVEETAVETGEEGVKAAGSPQMEAMETVGQAGRETVGKSWTKAMETERASRMEVMGIAEETAREAAGEAWKEAPETGKEPAKETAGKSWKEAVKSAKTAGGESAGASWREPVETAREPMGETGKSVGKETVTASAGRTNTAGLAEGEAEADVTGRNAAGSGMAGESEPGAKAAGMFHIGSAESFLPLDEMKNMPDGGEQAPIAAPGTANADENARGSREIQSSGRLESRVFSCLPAMYPFEHQEFERSVRMEPQDLGLLPREMWKYAGNSFLLHSYYAYHHILFVRKVRGKERSCFLMLPGVYNPKEQHMAQLFGFSRFCPVRKKALQQGDFGYWYMEVCFPKEA